MTEQQERQVSEEDKGMLRGFWALIATQFQGAFNDNLYRFLIVFYILGKYSPGDEAAQQAFNMKIMGLATVLFAIPFLLFPGLAGTLADRYSKRSVSIATKVWEIGVMVLALFAFMAGSPWGLFFLLFMMFTQSAFFSPAKYGILPEIMPEGRLSWANGILNATTYVAIIGGQLAAGKLDEWIDAGMLNRLWASGLLILLSVTGLFCSLGIPRTAPAAPEKPFSVNPWSGLGAYFRVFWKDQVLWLCMLGGVYFWLFGAVAQVNVVNHALTTLHTSESGSTLLLVHILVGIGLGSAAAGFISRGRIEFGLIPIGLFLMTLCAGLLAVPGLSFWPAAMLTALLGVGGGLFVVPIMAAIQHRTPREMKGGVIAAFNIATCSGVLLGGLLYLGLGKLGWSTNRVFLLSSVATAGVGIYLCVRMPYFFIRSILWGLINTIYRLTVIGKKNVPAEGGALLVSNHMSYMDALFLVASIDRPIRFIMSAEFQKQNAWVRPLAAIGRAISVSPMASPRDLLRAMKEASQSIREGELVCIFAEGQISRSGQLLSFKKGFEHIVKGTGAPIIPVHLDRLWGSLFSFSEGKVLWKWPRKIPYPVTVSYGEPMPDTATAFDVRMRILELGAEAYMIRPNYVPLTHRGFIRTARRNPLKKALADQTTPCMSYFKALVASIIFGRKLNALLDKHEMVGVLVPPTVGGALTNIALSIMGRVPVNLNYTASAEAIRSSAEQCNITHVITAKAFLKKLPVEVPGKPIYLEDVKNSVTAADRLVALMAALFLPARLIEKLLGCRVPRKPEDLCTIIFSSGSEGIPKGVMLTHRNIVSNVECCMQIIPLMKECIVMGFLPFFHSFGFTTTLWLPLMNGGTGVYHPNPMETRAIARLIYEHQCNILFSAPTFLMTFLRRSTPEELSSLRIIITGAEKLSPKLREAFSEKFGIEPLEGYGCTELSPVVSTNLPNYRAPGYFQVALRHGTVGKPIPGDAIRVVDPDSDDWTPLPANTPGLLLVKGPNVMKGYIGMPEKTAEVIQDGWYVTGDIACIDEDGFISITDRLSRFSKIGGEMVPHTKVENTLHNLLGIQNEVKLAVAGVPDEKKGERLVVLHTLTEQQVEELLEKLPDSGLPNLWIPKSNAFYRVEEIPLLGSGKLALQKIKNLAKEKTSGEQ